MSPERAGAVYFVILVIVATIFLARLLHVGL